MNPRDFDPDITRIVDELRASGGIITGLFIRRADGTCIGKDPARPRECWVEAERGLAMQEYGRSPIPELPMMPKK